MFIKNGEACLLAGILFSLKILIKLQVTKVLTFRTSAKLFPFTIFAHLK